MMEQREGSPDMSGRSTGFVHDEAETNVSVIVKQREWSHV
jgi:hypothetical protein